MGVKTYRKNPDLRYLWGKC